MRKCAECAVNPETAMSFELSHEQLNFVSRSILRPLGA